MAEIPMADDNGLPLFNWPSEEPHLLGSRCKDCGEVIFPRRPQCPKCYTETMEEIHLSRKGKVYSSTVSYISPPMYQVPVPYAIGHVELPEKVLIPTTFSLANPEVLPIGTEVELVIEKWGEDEKGNIIMQPRFRPV